MRKGGNELKILYLKQTQVISIFSDNMLLSLCLVSPRSGDRSFYRCVKQRHGFSHDRVTNVIRIKIKIVCK